MKSESIRVHACKFIDEILSKYEVSVAENTRENIVHVLLGCLNVSLCIALYVHV